LPAAYEVLVTHTSPDVFDSNSNLVSDGGEDPDGDGLSNIAEMKLHTDPLTRNDNIVPRTLLVYYGTPSLIEGANRNLTDALKHLTNHDYVGLLQRIRGLVSG
jgi:hypothetical protein